MRVSLRMGLAFTLQSTVVMTDVRVRDSFIVLVQRTVLKLGEAIHSRREIVPYLPKIRRYGRRYGEDTVGVR